MFESFTYGIFGLILGSFANVVILREEKEEGINGRSHCTQCGRMLVWYELVPVLSFVFLRGKCRTCMMHISWQYPIVEICMAAGSVVIGMAPVPGIVKIFGIPMFFLALCIAVYDLRTTYIPDRWAYLFAALALMYAFVSPPIVLGTPLFVLLSGPIVALPLFALWLVSGGRWMGFGDVKLALGFGWLLGVFGGYLALSLAFILGAGVGLILIGITRLGKVHRGFTMKSEVPFGPFLIVSLCIVWFAQLYGYGLPAILVPFLSLN